MSQRAAVRLAGGDRFVRGADDLVREFADAAAIAAGCRADEAVRAPFNGMVPAARCGAGGSELRGELLERGGELGGVEVGQRLGEPEEFLELGLQLGLHAVVGGGEQAVEGEREAFPRRA